MFDALKKILWKYPSEQFSYMAQRVLEKRITELVRNAIIATGLKKVALAGGVFSNIKVNMLIRTMPEVQDCFVFPHMEDGGLALGAALASNYALNGITSYRLEDVFRAGILPTQRSKLFLTQAAFPTVIVKISSRRRRGLSARARLCSGSRAGWSMARGRWATAAFWPCPIQSASAIC